MDIHLSLINLNNYSQHLLTKSTFKVLTDEQLTLQLIKSRTSHSRSSDRLILASHHMKHTSFKGKQKPPSAKQEIWLLHRVEEFWFKRLQQSEIIIMKA